MGDTRFTSVCNELDELIDVIDIDEVGDIETLLMVVFARPVRVAEAWDEDGVITGLEVTLSGNAQQVTSTIEFPMNAIQLVRWSAETVADLGPYVDGDEPAQEKPVDVLGLPEDDLITELQQALGQVRLFNMMDADEEG